jgi:hypothetical protein
MHQEQAEGRARRRAFVAALHEGRSVTGAARAVGLNRTLLYKWRAEMPDFAAAWDEAVETAADLLEEEALRRALQGVQKPIFYRGEQIGAVTTYSERLLMFLLQRLRPVAPPAPRSKADALKEQEERDYAARLAEAHQRMARFAAAEEEARRTQAAAAAEISAPEPPAPDPDDDAEASPFFAPLHDDAPAAVNAPPPPDDAGDAPPRRAASPDARHGPPPTQITRRAPPTSAPLHDDLWRRPDPGGSANRRRSPA